VTVDLWEDKNHQAVIKTLLCVKRELGCAPDGDEGDGIVLVIMVVMMMMMMTMMMIMMMDAADVD